MKNQRLFLIFAVLLIASLACSLTGGGGDNTGVGDSTGPGDNTDPGDSDSPSSSPSSSGKYDTEFPMPSKVENFMDLGDDAINYQTPMKLTEVVEFYRGEFDKAGYKERPILTVINDDTFSIVWDGHPNGKAIVVQGVDLGNGTVNVNVRFEDV